jgi:hypothetical protein
VALVQLNLKVPPAVADHWRSQAAAAHLSVRDWLVRQTGPHDPEATPQLVDRVEALEAAVEALQTAAAAAPQPAPQPDPLPAPSPQTALPHAPQPAAAITTQQLAVILGCPAGSLRSAVARAGGPASGVTVTGWRCIGLHRASPRGPQRVLWVPADTQAPTG